MARPDLWIPRQLGPRGATARRMRGYVQQRQTLPSSAVLIWASSGSAFRSSSATVLMIMPAVQ